VRVGLISRDAPARWVNSVPRWRVGLVSTEVGARSPDRAPGRDRRVSLCKKRRPSVGPGHGQEDRAPTPAAGRRLHPFAKRSNRRVLARRQRGLTASLAGAVGLVSASFSLPRITLLGYKKEVLLIDDP